MNDQTNPNRAKEFKRLLERLERLTPPPEAAPYDREPLSPLEPSVRQDVSSDLPVPLVRPPPDWQPPRRSSGISMWVLVLATGLNTVVAAALAAFITLQATQPDTDGGVQDLWQRISAAPSDAGAPDATASFAAPAQEPVPAGSIHLTPIGTAEAPLTFEPERASPFPLRIEPPEAERDAYILVLSGLPTGSRLTGADPLGSDTWLLSPGGADGLELTISEQSPSVIEVAVELRRTDGGTAAATKAWLLASAPVDSVPTATPPLVAPVPAPATPPPVAAPLPPRAPSRPADPEAVQRLFERSRQLLERGDIAAARTLYERAARMGHGESAFMLGSTYDPNRLWGLGVFGMVGNKERALQWYQRADQLGHPQAKERMKLLSQ